MTDLPVGVDSNNLNIYVGNVLGCSSSKEKYHVIDYDGNVKNLKGTTTTTIKQLKNNYDVYILKDSRGYAIIRPQNKVNLLDDL